LDLALVSDLVYLHTVYERISIDPRQMNGEPCIRGLRIPVATILTLIAQGHTIEGILNLYPDLQREDINESLAFAAEMMRERQLPLEKVG